MLVAPQPLAPPPPTPGLFTPQPLAPDQFDTEKPISIPQKPLAPGPNPILVPQKPLAPGPNPIFVPQKLPTPTTAPQSYGGDFFEDLSRR